MYETPASSRVRAAECVLSHSAKAIEIEDIEARNSPENPVAGGSVIGSYTTGAGQTIPPSVDGQIASQPPPAVAGPVSALIQGVPADIAYAGTIPGLVTAVQQFELRVPSVPNPGIARLQLVLGSTPYDIGNIWVRLP